MDKIEQYKNLNEQVRKLLRQSTPKDLNEEVSRTAQELVETLEDPGKLSILLRTGLVQANRISRVRNALKDPDKAMKNASIRSDLINMLMTLINVVTANPSAFASVRKGVKGATALAAEGESSVVAEGSGGVYDDDDMSDSKPVKKGNKILSPKQKRLDMNKNNKLDAEDFAALRASKDRPAGASGFSEMYSHITEAAKIQSEKAFAKKWLSNLKKTDMDDETTSKFGTLGATLSDMVKVFGKPHTNNKYTIEWMYESKMKDGSKIKFNIYQDKKDDSYDKDYWSFGSMDSPGNDHHYEIGEYLSQFLMDIDFAH